MNRMKNTGTALCLAALLPGSYAAAQDFTIGAQGCMPMNLPLAQTLQWRSEGLINNNTVEQWVVCPLAIDTRDENLDVLVRVRNRSEETAQVQCLYKTTSEIGNTLKSISQKATVRPDVTVSMITSNINFQDGDAFSVSCLLPPKFSITSFSVELPG